MTLGMSECGERYHFVHNLDPHDKFLEGQEVSSHLTILYVFPPTKSHSTLHPSHD
jgi:hypothetical protein